MADRVGPYRADRWCEGRSASAGLPVFGRSVSTARGVRGCVS